MSPGRLWVVVAEKPKLTLKARENGMEDRGRGLGLLNPTKQGLKKLRMEILNSVPPGNSSTIQSHPLPFFNEKPNNWQLTLDL